MKYFVFDQDREDTCYHEFYKGKWDGHTFWKKDSISISDDNLCNCIDFIDAISEIVSSYDCFGETEISRFEWEEIGEVIKNKGRVAQEIYKEADEWLKEVFEKHECFTILGI